jgi:hypothetical protein
VVNSRRKADIVIAHSAACYSLPVRLRAQLVMFIDPPYWPGRTLRSRFKSNFKSVTKNDIGSFGRKYHLRKRVLQSIYMITRSRYFWLGVTKHKSLNFLRLNVARLIIVRNKDDDFCGPELKNIAKNNRKIKYVELPGLHDDFIVNPKPYIELLSSELREI